MRPLMERCQGFAQTKPTPVKRGGQSYADTEVFVRRGIRLMLWLYNRSTTTGQIARLTRDVIDFLLRRYHGYSIKEHIGAHYRQRGLKKGDRIEFEHVLPNAVARDMLLVGRLTATEVMNVPTCRLSKKKHAELAASGLGDSTPNVYYFFRRYRDLGIEIETQDGVAVDLDSWSLDDHYRLFGITVASDW